jgi:DNA-binding protein H-NS
MNAIKKLTAKELTKLMDQAASELANRKRIETLNKDIQKVLAKHKVTKPELTALIDSLRGQTKLSKSKARAASKVAPKFKNPTGSETWTGRGRAPNWVTSLCNDAGISIDEFKTSTHYLI